jgi:formylglycine-generating enzyme required for sulfatase activity
VAPPSAQTRPAHHPARARHRPGASILAVSALAAAAAAGCKSRSQLLIVVDGDFAVPETLGRDPRVSPDAVIDTVRVDFIDQQTGEIMAVRERALLREDELPMSFGVCTHDDEGTCGLEADSLRVRVRAFRASFARREFVGSRSVLRPPPGVTIDRVFDVPTPTEEKTTRRVDVVLSMDCIGVPPSFLPPETTCIDGWSTSAALTATAPPYDDLDYGRRGSAPPPRVGTWHGLRERHCRAPPTEGRLCVLGGFTVLGDPEADLVSEDLEGHYPSGATWPGRPARLSPFWMDRTEVTVGEYKRLMPKEASPASAETPAGVGSVECEASKYSTWRGHDDAQYDGYPLNCISRKLAAAICDQKGGALPTEAQWEHAARGRGARRRYPWGDAEASCCHASVGRSWIQGNNACLAVGPEPVGSHLPNEHCQGDVSADGIVDLGGGVYEPVLGALSPYDHPCWGRGPTLDPVCWDDGTTSPFVVRGGVWGSGLASAHGAMRPTLGPEPSSYIGVRCAYEDEP